MMGGRKKALEFVKKVDEIESSLTDTSNHKIATTLGLSEDGMDEACTMLSLDIIQDIQKGGLGFEPQSHLFQMGVTLGRAYERKVAGEQPRDESE